MYSNLRAEMARRSVTIRELSSKTGIRYQTLCEKIKQGRGFSFKDAVKIRDVLCPSIDLETLFNDG